MRLIEPMIVPALIRTQSEFVLFDAFEQLKYINLFWGLINLLPVYPLDGGQIVRTWMSSRRGIPGLRTSLLISIIASGGAAVWFYQRGGQLDLPVILFGLLCFESIQNYQSLGP